jgi:hypothetical protein
MTMKSRQALGDAKRLGRVLDCEPVNVQPIMIEDRFGHRRGLSITSTSTAASG